MIAEIRKHIKDSIKLCDSKYKMIENPYHKDEDLVDTKADHLYALAFGSAVNIIGDESGNVKEVPVDFKTYRQGGRDKLANFDAGYEDALIINSLILDRLDLNSKNYIKGMTSSNVTPVEIADSQDIYSYETNFIFTISYGIGD